MTVVEANSHPRAMRRFETSVVEGGSGMRQAQRLRWRVFAADGGARLGSEDPGATDGLDEDRFDPYCAHVLVRDTATDQVIGTYRILTGVASRETGGFYSETEFDLERLSHLRVRIAELGRSCVHPDYRSGTVIALLWGAIADYIAANKCDVLIGCASVPMRDGGQCAATVWHELAATRLAPLEYRVTPRTPVVFTADAATRSSSSSASVPPLVKGYLRAGAWVCGPPHWDPDFNTADFLMMLQLGQLDQRYARHYLADAATDVVQGYPE